MNSDRQIIKLCPGLVAHSRTPADVNLEFKMPSHGGNTGSNPVGDANEFKNIGRTTAGYLTHFSQRRSWMGLDSVETGAVS